MSLTRFTYILITVVLIGFLLTYLESFLIPLVFSIGIWFLIRKFRKLLTNKIRMPYWLSTSLASLIILCLLYLFTQLLALQVKAFMTPDNLQKYNENFRLIGDKITALVGVEALQNGLQQLRNIDIAGILQSSLGALTNLLGNSFMVILYLLFLLLEENVFKTKFKAIYSTKEKQEDALKTIQQIIKSVESYITLKTIVSLITGVLSYLGLLLLGVDFALFWAIVIFVLNYIPTVGSLIATVFPALMSLIQYPEQSGVALFVLIVVGIIQVIVGNVVEPRIMGENLNISPLVVILSLTLWGLIWGVVGMILSVPIMVVLIIIFSKIPSTRNIAVMLSSDGNI